MFLICYKGKIFSDMRWGDCLGSMVFCVDSPHSGNDFFFKGGGASMRGRYQNFWRFRVRVAVTLVPFVYPSPLVHCVYWYPLVHFVCSYPLLT